MNDIQDTQSSWQQIKAYVLLGISFIFSPCCTPLIIPIILSLLGGTPIALWLGQNLGWVYGGLTLVSAVSVIFALRWIYQSKGSDLSSTDKPITTLSTE